ncbi:hypothetical protein LZ31DRAFT_339861 [Colletotrichum somersetense]|nr:hypothetical protein LZ31DRAFT_339861 [Colletotrichum somersetense]
MACLVAHTGWFVGWLVGVACGYATGCNTAPKIFRQSLMASLPRGLAGFQRGRQGEETGWMRSEARNASACVVGIWETPPVGPAWRVCKVILMCNRLF